METATIGVNMGRIARSREDAVLLGGGLPPLLWAQGGVPGSSPAQDAEALAALALRRWCSSLTLSSPELSPGSTGLLAWLAALGALLLLALLAQGPRRTLRQLIDIPDHLRLARLALQRLQRSTRLIAALLGSTVLVWSFHQSLTYDRTERLNDLLLLRKSRDATELAIEQGSLAALVPLRDLASLGDNLPLLVAAAVWIFLLSASRWDDPTRSTIAGRTVVPWWSTLSWAGASLYAVYLLGRLVAGGGGLPPGGCLIVEAAVVPLLMLLADGLLLAWVLVELRATTLGATGEQTVDVSGALRLLPAAMLGCLVAVPGRYAATAVWLMLPYAPRFVSTTGLASFLQGWGIVWLQAAFLPFWGVAVAGTWSRAGATSAVRGYVRLLRAEGGRLLALTLAAGLLGGALSGASYWLVLSFPASAWLLNAADSYAHYLTLPIGLLALTAGIELAARSLPQARLADPRQDVNQNPNPSNIQID
jgi:hypothetical protein